MTRQDYQYYLSAIHWQSFVKSAKSDRCASCGTTKSLHLHHLSYKNIGHELSNECITLCLMHHFSIHFRYNELKRQNLFRKTKFKPNLKLVTLWLIKDKQEMNKARDEWLNSQYDENGFRRVL